MKYHTTKCPITLNSLVGLLIQTFTAVWREQQLIHFKLCDIFLPCTRYICGLDLEKLITALAKRNTVQLPQFTMNEKINKWQIVCAQTAEWQSKDSKRSSVFYCWTTLVSHLKRLFMYEVLTYINTFLSHLFGKKNTVILPNKVLKLAKYRHTDCIL